MIYIAQYDGVSPFSCLEKWFNWTLAEFPSSHTAIYNDSIHAGHRVCFEATPKPFSVRPGVNWEASLSVNHTPGTKVFLFRLVNPLSIVEENRLISFCDSQCGKGYDYSGLINFVTRPSGTIDFMQRWFCSELTFQAFLEAGRELLARVPAYKVSPTMILLSSELILDRILYTE